MFKLPIKVKNDIEKYRENLGKFLKGELKDAFFRGIRVPWGHYSQRGGKILMSRLRIPGGILTPEQLKAIGVAARDFADGKLHITTRQDIQIHNVPYENSIKVIDYLSGFDLSPRGGGGNTLRNITCCSLSGICPDEHIEAYKLVWGLTEYLMPLDESYNLPRKFKIAFSGCDKDCAFAGVNDVGFVASDGGFKVLCGGGMGAKSAVGKVLQENVEPEEVGYVAKAVMNVFNKYGDRKNRHQNRLRFLIQGLGWERFVELYHQELNKVKETEHIVFRTDAELPKLPEGKKAPAEKSADQGYNLFLKANVYQPKQEGYFSVMVRIPSGEIDSGSLISLSNLGNDLPAIIFRTTQRQNLVISNVPGKKIKFVYEKVHTIVKDYLFPETILDITCCKSVLTCNLGLCNAIGLGAEVAKGLERIPGIEELKDVRININGCPNACGQHPIGTVSLSGHVKRVYGRSVPFYKIHLGGRAEAEHTRLAEDIGAIPARVAPQLISEFVQLIQKNARGDSYGYILNNGKKDMLDLIKRYSYVPPYEENRDYYVDFGKKEDFSLEGLTQGECGAGVIDMIESDLESAKQSLVKAKEKNFDLSEVKRALVYSASSLLVLKGIDPKNDLEVVSSFVSTFIDTGICRPDFKNLKAMYEDITAGKIDKEKAYEYVSKLYEEASQIYSLMDSNFNLPARFAPSEASPAGAPQAKAEVYDLRGTPCPINYVKTKLKLEAMNVGDVLEVYLDDGEPIDNVPKSLKSDGQEIVKIEPVENFFKVVVVKKV